MQKTTTKTEYPRYKSKEGQQYSCIGWSVCLRNGWEHYAFELVDKENEIYFGFVHGWEDEFGDFSAQELRENGINFITDPRKLNQIAPPVGWTRV